jgi:hypothetical protein
VELFDRLFSWLRSHGGGQRAADAEAGVRALECRYRIRLPDDFRRYLLQVAPDEDVTDDELTTWWALGRIRNIPDEYEGEISNLVIAAGAGEYLFFADYIFWCWAWAVCCSEGPNRGKVAFIGGPNDFVADSFAEFVERYLHDPAGMAEAPPPTWRERGQRGSE